MYVDEMKEVEPLSEKDEEYIIGKYKKILERIEEIDGILNEASKTWKTSRMSRVDLTVLRLAGCTKLFYFFSKFFSFCRMRILRLCMVMWCRPARHAS